MNRNLDSRFLAGVRKNHRDELTGSALTSADGFFVIYEKINETVKKIAGELHAGKADANPLIYKKENPCDYCKAKALCRKDKEKGGSYGKTMD